MAQEDSKLSMIAVLTIIMIISATILTGIFIITKPKIDAHKAEAKRKAILNVLPGAKRYETIEKGGFELYKGYDENGSPVGTAIQTEGSGFQSVIKLMLGMDLENNKVLAIKILSHTETPGLGARITEDWFENQFNDKSFTDEFKAKEDIESIAGSTISSQAVSDIVKQTVKKVNKAMKDGRE